MRLASTEREIETPAERKRFHPRCRFDISFSSSSSSLSVTLVSSFFFLLLLLCSGRASLNSGRDPFPPISLFSRASPLPPVYFSILWQKSFPSGSFCLAFNSQALFFPSLSYSAAVLQSFSFLFSLSVKIFKKEKNLLYRCIISIYICMFFIRAS